MKSYDFWAHYKHNDVISRDLRTVCRACPTLTFDQRSPSGFSEIEVVRGEPFVATEQVVSGDKEGIARDLIGILRRHIVEAWNPDEHHTIFMSAGRDSQILMLILRDLVLEGFNLGEVLVMTTEPEQVQAQAFIDEHLAGSWDFEWLPWRAGRSTSPDYYDIRFGHNTNAFNHPTFCHFPADLPEKSVCVYGFPGGELLEYPATKQTLVSLKNGSHLGGLDYFIRDGILTSSNIYACWKDFIGPYLDVDYMSYVFAIPPEFFKYSPAGGDELRYAMLYELTAEDAQSVRGHTYNLSWSQASLNLVRDEYKASRFMADFGFNEVVRNSVPHEALGQMTIQDFGVLDLKLYGLATMYEGI